MVEQVILKEYNQIQEQLHSLDEVYIQYYSKQDEDSKNGEQLENKISEDEEIEAEVQPQASKKLEKAMGRPRNRFLALLRRPRRWIAGLRHRGTYIVNEEPSNEIPGPSHINMEDSMADSKGRKLLRVSQVFRNNMDHQTGNMVEQVILKEYKQIQEQLHSLDEVHIQYYSKQDEDSKNGEQLENKISEDEEIEAEVQPQASKKLEKAMGRPRNRFLALLRRPRRWIAGLKHRGTYIVNEEPSNEIPGPSHINMEDSMADSKASMSHTEDQKDDEGKQHTIKSSRKKMDTCRSAQDVCRDPSSIDPTTREELRRSAQSSSSSGYQDTTAETSVVAAGTSAQAFAATVPLSLESFTFHRSLGQGGFAQVYLATDRIRRERVAIKVLDKRVYTQAGYSFGERHILQLSHASPFLIHGLAAFHTLNFVYYVMEVATRGDLHDLILKICPLDTVTVRFIIAEVVCGTEFLHSKGILHRDLKPENLLLTTEGHIKITDFGLAVKGVSKRITDDCRGTPGYAAPEIIRGLPHGRAVDYFAIGVTLYGLVTATLPFPGEGPRDCEQSVLYHEPHFPESLPPDTVSILQGLLCKDQFHRLGVKGDIREHQFFSDINWEDVEARKMAPPEILRSEAIDLNVEDTMDYAEPPHYIKSKYQKMFNQFSFVCPEWSTQYHPVITRNWVATLFNRWSSQ
ncbi:protein kinase C-like 1B [Engystomops pustulosus]|uniref:protein kinase C-like 1B n=1 Tax=Engystomops pustulosus TaxID=76066 RepID=UPI003AFAD9E8